MIEIASVADVVVGANRKGEISGAPWTYLLPRLSLRRALCIGEPDAATRRTLERLAATVDVRPIPAANGVAASSGALGLELLPEGSIDLVVLTSRSGPVRRDQRALSHLRRALGPDGRLYIEPGRPEYDAAALRGAGFGSVVPLRSTSSGGAVRSAVPAEDLATVRYFAANGHEGHRLLPLGRSALARRLGRAVTSAFPTGATALLAAVEPGADEVAPRWVRQIAARSGADIEHHRWGLWARGDYESQKVVLFLFRGDEPGAEVVVKLTRHPMHNHRLENERRALELLHDVEVCGEGRVPRRVFHGCEGGLAVLGESMVHGRPYATAADASPDNPLLHDAATWLTALGSATAVTHDAPPVAAVLDRLVRRFDEVYRPSAATTGFLESQVAAFETVPSLPLVFQHGDPGVWNLLVQPSGKVSFLDWEACDPEGLPLWDLFYFLRSAATHASRVEGVRGWMRPVLRHFLEGSPFTPAIAGAVRSYVDAVGVPPTLVGPLFHLCWVHRALKEAGRLPAGRLDTGHYATLVRRSHEAHRSPALTSILTGADHG